MRVAWCDTCQKELGVTGMGRCSLCGAIVAASALRGERTPYQQAKLLLIVIGGLIALGVGAAVYLTTTSGAASAAGGVVALILWMYVRVFFLRRR